MPCVYLPGPAPAVTVANTTVPLKRRMSGEAIGLTNNKVEAKVLDYWVSDVVDTVEVRPAVPTLWLNLRGVTIEF
jgi:hypothetical protein